ncbi:MAG: PadR family transcriptional regulator [Clostridia bacterium]|nr:PadR family transcriptional regulator [Clostridia bacterium]
MTIQFKKGVLEMCVLSLLRNGDRYGYDVACELSKTMEVSDGSVYPVLRRLKDDGYVTSYLEEASGGPPRKYYVITDAGSDYMKSLQSEWKQLTGDINKLLDNGGQPT